MTEKHTVNERAALYGNHLAIIVKLSVKRLRIQWKPRRRHEHVRHTLGHARIDVQLLERDWLIADRALFTCASRRPRARERQSGPLPFYVASA